MINQKGNPFARAAASRYRLLALGWLLVTGALAQQAAAPDSDPATIAARRFPQPVRVGALVNRAVLEPVESRRILGHVDEIVRLDGGKLAAIMTFGGFLGFGAHQIAVPLDAMVLLGNEMEVLDYTPEQLGAFPTYHGNGTALGTGEIIRVGLGHPSH